MEIDLLSIKRRLEFLVILLENLYGIKEAYLQVHFISSQN
jgi:hypothetical protein